MSGSMKFARGGGRGLNRMAPPALGRGMTPLRAPAPGKGKERPDVGAPGKGRGQAMKADGGRQCREENFQLVSCAEQGAPPLCALTIRLTPGLLDSLKREEELGGIPMIKFGSNGTGNVIKVGEEEFRFSSAPESGHLCDIFEEQKTGDKGDGLLHETGAVCQKLSVIRTLSDTDKNRVKARSVEAERQQKSRQAIILDHKNALINNSKVVPSGDGASTVNGRRPPPAKAKKEPPLKKRKGATGSGMPPISKVTPTRAEKPPVPVAPPKFTKTAVPSPENRLASSHTSVSQAAAVPSSKPKGKAVEEVGTPAGSNSATVSLKDKVPSPALPVGGETGGVARISGAISTTELRNILIMLLVENPKGMTIKAVDKALAGAMPNVRQDKKQVEKAIKAIASFHAPGKYLLKEGVEKGGFTRPSPGSGSSPDTVPVESPAILADSPSLMENAAETRREKGGTNDGDAARGVASHEDTSKADGSSQNSVLPLPLQRGNESAVSRAIRKATDIFQGNAERPHPPGQDKPTKVVESPGQTVKELNMEDLAPVADGGSGGAESPAQDSPDTALLLEDDATEAERIVGDVQNGDSLHSDEGEFKKESSDGRQSSSSTSSSGSGDSESDGEGDSDSDSESVSESDSESDGSSSSGREDENLNREDENMDEIVDIISDDDEKMDMAEDVQQISKPKDSSNAFEQQEGKAQRPDAGNELARVTQSINSEEEVDVDVCDEDTPLPQDQKQEQAVASSAESGKDAVRQKNGLSTIQVRSGSESDHSIEELETRAEINGVRGARGTGATEQKAQTHRRRIGVAETVASPRRKDVSEIKVHTPDNVEAENKLFNGMSSRDSEVGSGLLPNRDHLKSREASFKQSGGQRLLQRPPSRRDDSNQTGWQRSGEASTKTKPPESAKQDPESAGKVSTDMKPGEVQMRSTGAQKGLECPNKTVERSSKPAKFSSEAMRKFSGVAESLGKVEGMSKLSEETRATGPDTRETITVDHIVRSTQYGDVRPDVHRKNKEGSIGKGGKASSFVAEKEPGRNISMAVEPESKLGNDNKVQKVAGNKAAAKSKVPHHTNDLELGELRGIVAGEAGRPKDSVRHEDQAAKLREPSSLAARQPADKAQTSSSVKLRGIGKQGGLKNRSPAVTTNQQLHKGIQKNEVPMSLRDTVRPASNAEKAGPSQDDGQEMGSGRGLDASAKTRAASSDHSEKHSDGRSGKRPAEVGAEGDSGRRLKRVAVDSTQQGSSLLHAEPDASLRQGKASSVLGVTGKPPDNGKGIPPADKGNHTPTYRSKVKGENGRVPVGERQFGKSDGNQKTATGLPRPGLSKKENPQSNGKRVSTPSSDSHGQEFFAPYEKKPLQRRGPISSYPQYLEYCTEYKEKYPIYTRVNTALESDKEDFERLSKDISAAQAANDGDTLGNIYGTVKNNYLLSRQRFKRMRRVFDLLHEELLAIKQHCKDYAAKVAAQG